MLVHLSTSVVASCAAALTISAPKVRSVPKQRPPLSPADHTSYEVIGFGRGEVFLVVGSHQDYVVTYC